MQHAVQAMHGPVYNAIGMSASRCIRCTCCRMVPYLVRPHTPARQATYGYSSVVMVGDGATDLEARLEGAASLFIG